MTGVVLLAVALAAGTLLLARRHGLLAPVAVGLGLRLALALVIQGTASTAAEGFAFLDESGHVRLASGLADDWIDGVATNPRAATGSYQFGWDALLAGFLVLTGPEAFVGKLLNVALGAVAVLLTGLIGGAVLGAQAVRPVAWVTALLPTAVLWSSVALKEALSCTLLLLALLLVLRLGRAWHAVALLAVVAALTVTRGLLTAALLPAVALAFAAATARHGALLRRRRLLGAALAASAVGLLALVVATRGQPQDLVGAYTATAGRMFRLYQGGDATGVPVDLVRVFVSPRPWSFDAGGAQGWYRAMYPGMWVLYGLLPLAALGVWRGRHRPEVLLLVAVTLIFLIGHAAVSGSGVRQRSGVEPLLVVLAVGGVAGRREVAAAIGVVAAVVAPVSLLDGAPLVVPVVLVLVALAAAAAWRGLPRPGASAAPLPSPLLDVLRRVAPAG